MARYGALIAWAGQLNMNWTPFVGPRGVEFADSDEAARV
jgi:hypothetical protein